MGDSNLSVLIILIWLANLIVHVFAVERLMRVFFEKRQTSRSLVIGAYLIFFAMNVFMGLFLYVIDFVIGSGYVTGLIFRIPPLFVIALCYKSSLLKRVVAVLFAIIINEAIVTVMSNFVLAPALFIAFGSPFTNSNYLYEATRFIATAIFYFFSYLMYKRFTYIRQSSYDSSAFFGLVILVAYSIIILGVWHTGVISQLFYIRLHTAYLGVGAFLVFYLYNLNSKTHEEKLKSVLHEQEKEYYYNQCDLMQDSVEKMKTYRHDVKFHLAALKGFTADNKEATEYINDLLGNVEKSEIYSDTGNIAFDSIINFKLKDVLTNHINLQLKIFVPPALNIEVSDIVIILGNLLDNAFEAVVNVENKMIKLTVEVNKGVLFIKVENTFDGVIQYADNNNDTKKVIATRKDGDNHGYGLKNIQKSVDKYDGQMDVSHKDDIFSVAILLYTRNDSV